ncbi:MAG: hypothetical protein D6712_06160 [Chloroflexi bacterium]|nr:MAG: hypothetical protein D6712_06160 [Chloroflexota bacterium]
MKSWLSKNIFSTLFIYIGVLVIAVFIMLNVHEIGHTVFAKILGDENAYYMLIRWQPDGNLACIGCNHYDADELSYWGNFLTVWGGVIFTQLLAVGLLLYKRWRRELWGWHFFRVLVVVCVFDVFVQVFQGIIANVGQQTMLTNVDVADAIWLLTNNFHISPVFIKIMMLVVIGVYGWGIMRLYKLAIASKILQSPADITHPKMA